MHIHAGMIHAHAGTVHARARIIHTKNDLGPRAQVRRLLEQESRGWGDHCSCSPSYPDCEGANAQDLSTPRLFWTLSSFSPRARRLLKNPFRKVEAKPIRAQGLSGSALGLGFCSQDPNESQAQYQIVITCPC